MDLASTLSATFLAASLTAYLSVSFLEAGFLVWRNTQLLVGSAVTGARLLNDIGDEIGISSSGVESLRLLRKCTFAASLVATVALTISIVEVSWPWIALASALSLVALSVLASAAHALAPMSSALMSRYGVRCIEAFALTATPWIAAERLVIQVVGRRLPMRFASDERSNSQPLGAAPLGFEGMPLDEREVRMIRAVVRQDQTVAREIMVPRVDMSTVEMSTPIAEVAELMIESGHSKLPVYRETLDRIAGFVYSMDLIRVMGGDTTEKATLERLLRPPLLIPESKTLEGLLREFQDQRVQMAVVVDEYGGVSGVVTVEDLLEEIVGEIEDEFDVDEPEVVELTARTDSQVDLLIDARIGVDQVTELTGVDVQGDGFDTLGGFVLDKLGRMPSRGDIVDYDGLSIEVVSTAGRRLKRLRVRRRPLSN